MMDRDTLRAQVKRALERVTRHPAPAGWNTAPASLIDTFRLDSLAVLEFVLALEKGLGIEIPDEDVGPEMFRSADALVDYLSARLEVRA